MTADWPALEKLLDAGDTAGALAVVRDLDDKQRRALAKPLQEYAKRWQAEDFELGSDERYRWYRTAPALMVAVAGGLAGASAVATWLARIGSSDDHHAVLEALRARPQAWREEVALRLAEVRRLAEMELRELAVAWVAETGVEPPATDGFAAAWVQTLRFARRPLVDALREDPLLPHAHRLLFEPDDMGRYLQDPRWSGFPAALVTLAGEGRLDRGVIFDGCLRRLLRGGTPTQLRAYLQIYQGLRVSVDEAAARTHDLIALLPDSVSTVAALAQAELRRIDEAGRLPAGALAEASGAALFRPEKKLAAAQLSWLEAVIKQNPDRAPGLLPEVTVAFGHPAPEVQQKAVALLARHAKHLDAQARAQAAEAADALPGDLRNRLAEVLGKDAPAGEAPDTAGPAAAQAGLAPRPPAPAGVPAPIGSPAELAEEVAALLEITGNGWSGRDVDPVALERTLAGLVALTHADRAGVAAALALVCGRWKIKPGLPERASLRISRECTPSVSELFKVVVGAAVGQGDPGRADGWAGKITVTDRLTAPLRVLMCRMLEIAAGLAAGPVPVLVATPTAATGHIDPAVLLARLEQAAAQGWQPWEYDLQQALLRLPREADPQVAVAARRLGTPAGERLAGWLDRGGLPDPALQRVEYERDDYNFERRRSPGGGWEKITVLEVVTVPLPAAPPVPDSLAGMLLNLPGPRQESSGWTEGWDWTACWPTVAPSHRDLIAAYLLRQWLRAYEGAGLPLLAEADGPVGPGISLAIAGGLGAGGEEARAATVDGMLILARRGQLDGTAVGTDLATLVNHGNRKLTRVVPRLRDAASAGARAPVWDAIAAALPPLLTAALDKPANGLADLVALGTEVAPADGTARPIPELAAYSGHKKGTRLAAEARRLHAHLTRAPA